MTQNIRNIFHGLMVSLGLAMLAILIFSIVMFLAWFIRNDGIYFLVFYINKGIYLFQIAIVIGLSASLFGPILKVFDMQLTVAEKLPSYIAFILIITCVVLLGFTDSGEMFYLHQK